MLHWGRVAPTLHENAPRDGCGRGAKMWSLSQSVVQTKQLADGDMQNRILGPAIFASCRVGRHAQTERSFQTSSLAHGKARTNTSKHAPTERSFQTSPLPMGRYEQTRRTSLLSSQETATGISIMNVRPPTSNYDMLVASDKLIFQGVKTFR